MGLNSEGPGLRRMDKGEFLHMKELSWYIGFNTLLVGSWKLRKTVTTLSAGDMWAMPWQTLEKEIKILQEAGTLVLCTTGKSTSSLCFIGVPRGHSIYQSRKEWAGERGILFPENLNETVLCRQGWCYRRCWYRTGIPENKEDDKIPDG